MSEQTMLDWPLAAVRKELGVSEPHGYKAIPPNDKAPSPVDLIRAAFVRDPARAIAA